MLSVTASGGREYNKLNTLRRASYVVKGDHPSVMHGAWPAEALAITDAGRTALAAIGFQYACSRADDRRQGLWTQKQSSFHR
jgi:hypothetical protein